MSSKQTYPKKKTSQATLIFSSRPRTLDPKRKESCHTHKARVMRLMINNQVRISNQLKICVRRRYVLYCFYLKILIIHKIEKKKKSLSILLLKRKSKKIKNKKK